MPKPNHRQARIGHGGREAWVDEGLADLLLALWQLGMPTEFSCQNFGLRRRPQQGFTHYGYICFTHLDHAMYFVRNTCRLMQSDERSSLVLETAGLRGFVDFPAHRLLAITAYWCNVSRETFTTSLPVETHASYYGPPCTHPGPRVTCKVCPPVVSRETLHPSVARLAYGVPVRPEHVEPWHGKAQEGT